MMRDNPLVCAVMLVHERDRRLIARAIEAYRSQMYERKNLLIYDSSSLQLDYEDLRKGELVARLDFAGSFPIGKLRNLANSLLVSTDVIVHWDSDDWSHPARMDEQVEHLRSSECDCVGYRDILFWRSDPFGSAWRYTNGNPRWALGTSLCYTRQFWEQNRFKDDLPSGPESASEYHHWMGRIDGISSIADSPRMIAAIHGGNTSAAYRLALMEASERQGGEWRRVPAFDAYCGGIMA